jgi:hypothetical protein
LQALPLLYVTETVTGTVIALEAKAQNSPPVLVPTACTAIRVFQVKPPPLTDIDVTPGLHMTISTITSRVFEVVTLTVEGEGLLPPIP